jgi:hypothetical protein
MLGGEGATPAALPGGKAMADAMFAHRDPTAPLAHRLPVVTVATTGTEMAPDRPSPTKGMGEARA